MFSCRLPGSSTSLPSDISNPSPHMNYIYFSVTFNPTNDTGSTSLSFEPSFIYNTQHFVPTAHVEDTMHPLGVVIHSMSQNMFHPVAKCFVCTVAQPGRRLPDTILEGQFPKPSAVIMHQDAADANLINVFAMDFEVVNPLARTTRLLHVADTLSIISEVSVSPST